MLFDAVDIVDGAGKNLINSKWVVTEISNDDKGNREEGYKARLVIRGDQETESDLVRRDSPTVLKSTLKLLHHSAAQENWNLECGDIKSAFLQDVFVKAPAEAELAEGEVWKLKKAVYGIGDGSRKFYLALRHETKLLNLDFLDSDKAVFFKHDKGKLEGAIIVHVDDLIMMGTEKFHETVS